MTNRRTQLLDRYGQIYVFQTMTIEDGRYALWGYADGPTLMTDAGRDLFENLLADLGVEPTVPEPAGLGLVGLALLGLKKKRA